ncbi:hypothetical protein C0993_008714 [Termitomyces sp. T159_Od127]|nr:hypothetical protein C0993_008714 [Termitomyces sp. T159_Od127]
MALYSLRRTPPTTKHPVPLTPPMTSTFRRRTPKPSLPPIAHIDRQLAARAPLTPPEDVFPQEQPFAHPKPDAPYTDWLDISRTRPPHFIAEKTCEMICYLWFATAAPEHSYPTPTSSPPFAQRPNPATTTLQLVATPTFVQFMQKLLETTQVSQSVIVLSLHYIYRLKDRNRFTPAQRGSEFRIAVAGLMMANKFLDDNTYTNKTWSEVSGIDLAEINRMEKEFLNGVDFNLYVDKSTYESWLNLLKGLVLAKERDSLHFRRTRSAVRAAKHAHSHPHASAGPAARTYTYSTRSRSSTVHTHRARSTSPSQTRRAATFSSRLPEPEPVSPSPAYAHAPLRPGAKRSAAAAFSPTSAAHPCKRPTPAGLQLQLHIPEYTPTASAPHSHSPLEGLQSFETMSLASPAQPQLQEQWAAQPRHAPETLVTPYAVSEDRRTAVPQVCLRFVLVLCVTDAQQNLYFYTLACSPMDREEEGRARKARLRYHQPPHQSQSQSQSQAAAAPVHTTYPHPHQHPHLNTHQHSAQYAYYRPQHVQVVHSATTSPMYTYAYAHAPPHPISAPALAPSHAPAAYTLPHFHETQWTRPPTHSNATATTNAIAKIKKESPVPAAPFANAGPPGVQFCAYQCTGAYPCTSAGAGAYPTPVQGSWGARRV